MTTQQGKRKASAIEPFDPGAYYRNKHAEYMKLVGENSDKLRVVVSAKDVEQFRYLLTHKCGDEEDRLLRWPTSYRDGQKATPGFRMKGKAAPSAAAKTSSAGSGEMGNVSD
jgi:hypothetical protein